MRTTRKVPEPDPAILRRALSNLERDDRLDRTDSNPLTARRRIGSPGIGSMLPNRMMLFDCDDDMRDCEFEDDDESDIDVGFDSDSDRGTECALM